MSKKPTKKPEKKSEKKSDTKVKKMQDDAGLLSELTCDKSPSEMREFIDREIAEAEGDLKKMLTALRGFLS